MPTHALVRLTGDLIWPVSTPFETAIGKASYYRFRREPLMKLNLFAGPLAGDFPILSLRTNKADVAVGIPQAVADKLDQAGERWRVNGK